MPEHKRKSIIINRMNFFLFNQDTIGKDLVFFFGEMDISLMDLKGVINFHGLAMLTFRNSKYAYKTLGNKSKTKMRVNFFLIVELA